MMEMMSSEYINFAQQGVHLNLSSALCSLATPPRRNQNVNKKLDSQYKFCSPPSSRAPNQNNKSSSKSMTRNSPSRLSPSQLHHGFYAGAKFGERPPPTELPKPPNHWMIGNINRESKEQSCIEMTNNLKVLLKVQS